MLHALLSRAGWIYSTRWDETARHADRGGGHRAERFNGGINLSYSTGEAAPKKVFG